ncbi:hypothetical protein HK096_005769, partial [Nowakowskiella sp. JEL0078]
MWQCIVLFGVLKKSTINVRNLRRSFHVNEKRKQSQKLNENIQNNDKTRGWRKYANAFRDKPGSYLIAFAILHEITAIVPLPLFYFLLSSIPSVDIMSYFPSYIEMLDKEKSIGSEKIENSESNKKDEAVIRRVTKILG